MIFKWDEAAKQGARKGREGDGGKRVVGDGWCLVEGERRRRWRRGQGRILCVRLGIQFHTLVRACTDFLFEWWPAKAMTVSIGGATLVLSRCASTVSREGSQPAISKRRCLMTVRRCPKELSRVLVDFAASVRIFF